MLDLALTAAGMFLATILIGFILIVTVLAAGYVSFTRYFTRGTSPARRSVVGMPLEATRMPRGKRARLSR